MFKRFAFASSVFLFILVSLISSASVRAQEIFSKDQEEKFQEAFSYFIAPSGKGNEEKSADLFSALLTSHPKNVLLLAYAGAATSRLAVTTIFPWKKMSYAEEGLAMMDKSLQIIKSNEAQGMHASTPVHLEVKWVAVRSFLAMPGFMNRAGKGRQLLNDILEHKQFQETSYSFQSQVWMSAAKVAIESKSDGDARKYLELIVANKTPSSLRDKASEMLKELAK